MNGLNGSVDMSMVGDKTIIRAIPNESMMERASRVEANATILKAAFNGPGSDSGSMEDFDSGSDDVDLIPIEKNSQKTKKVDTANILAELKQED